MIKSAVLWRIVISPEFKCPMIPDNVGSHDRGEIRWVIYVVGKESKAEGNGLVSDSSFAFQKNFEIPILNLE